MKSKTSSSSNLRNFAGNKVATESDPLLFSSPRHPNYNSRSSTSSTIRERRQVSAVTQSSPSISPQINYSANQNDSMTNIGPSQSGDRGEHPVSYDHEHDFASYEIYNESTENLRSARSIRSNRSQQLSTRGTSRTFSERERHHRGRTDRLHEYYNERANTIFSEHNPHDELLVEVNPEVLAVRKSALRVYEPLTYTWLIFAVGFSIFAAISMAKWTGLLPDLRFWIMLLPCWSSHFALFACHIYSAKSLFNFINDANSQRQLSDSNDHRNRTEYLPLLQRALKFGLKTGGISISLFCFEVLLYLKLSNIVDYSLATAMTPLWIIVGVGIIDGIICKTQHVMRVFSWILALAFMILLVRRFDYEDEELRLRIILGPLLALLAMVMGSLIYILYGHLIGFFHLSRSQVYAGIFYSLGTIGIGVLFGLFSIVHMVRPIVFQMRVVMVALAPLSVSLLGLGAWAITKDEFDRLLQHGGQESIQPKKLRLEKAGWTAVNTKGAMNIPMFGEVSYEPLDPATKTKIVELCMCCACYPYGEEEEVLEQTSEYSTFQASQTRPGLRIPSSTNA